MRYPSRLVSSSVLLVMAAGLGTANLSAANLSAGGLNGATAPARSSKAAAPTHLKQVFADQDDTQSRKSAEGLQLLRRSLDSKPGIERSLTQKEVSAHKPAQVIARFDRFPTQEEWERWDIDGVKYIQYLGSRHWLVRVETSVAEAFAATRALSFSELLPSDKVVPELDRYQDHLELYDRERHLLELDVTLTESSEALRRQLREAFHQGGKELQGDESFVDNSGGKIVTLVTPPDSVARLALLDSVQVIAAGAWRNELLMDGVRAVVHAETVLGVGGQTLTGEGIRMANKELIGAGAVHEDLWEHDLAGNPTVPRWTPLVETDCTASSYSDHYQNHALMTAANMLGSGWQSERNGGAPLAFRGIAPKATYECYYNTGARAHLSSHSYVGTPTTTATHWDAAIVGDSQIEKFHAHVASGGNSGLDLGYFAMKNNAKNALIVANSQVNGRIHPSNSSGPTYDGRIKPDIAAPTRNFRGLEEPGFDLEIERIELVRGNSSIYF